MTKFMLIGVDASKPGEVKLVASLGGRILPLSDRTYPDEATAYEDFASSMRFLINGFDFVDSDELAEATNTSEIERRLDGIESRIDDLEG